MVLRLSSVEPDKASPSAGAPISTSGLAIPAPTTFEYERLDPSVDSVRLLVLLPGNEDDDVACELIHRTFASKPKFEALSYTWGDASNLKSIRLHGFPFEIRENLYRALSHLRSKTEKRLIWADAICIDQTNVEERSNQVRLMSFIYSRAQGVLVWLGIPLPRFLTEDRTRFINEEVDDLCNHPYWRRIWIIQEVSLARDMTICFSNADLDWTELEEPFSRISDSRKEELYEPIDKVLDQRENRHDDKNRLELLLERFSEAQCGEVRDKVYGFLGLAHDCYDESLKVDYSASLFDIFADVVKFQNAAKPLDGPFYYERQRCPVIDRPARLVRFAQLVQRAFDGAVDIAAKSRTSKDGLKQLFYARGYIAGTILYLGNSYSEHVSSFAAERQWRHSWDKHYTNTVDLARLREMDDAYAVKLLEMGETDLVKIRQIHSRSAFGFQEEELPTTISGESSFVFRKRQSAAKNEKGTNTQDEADSVGEPRRFLGSLLAFGLVPPAAREGDLICRFWDCDVAVVVRKVGAVDRYNIIGRADVAGMVKDRTQSDAEDAINQRKCYGDNSFSHMDFRLDMETLQKMTV